MRAAAGEFDRRVEVWDSQRIDDGTATVEGEPQLLATIWAKKLDVSDGERVRAAEQGSEVTTRWRVRSTALTRDLGGRHTLRHRDRIYAVTGAKESNERDDVVEITSTARTDMDPAS